MLSETKDLVFRMSPRFVRRRLFPAPGSRSPFTRQILQRRAIFIHVPKAAGTTLKTEIYGRASGGHRSIAEFAAADPDKTAAFFTFSFVRNPWDRMLSAYSWVGQAEGTTPTSKEFARNHLRATATFEDFVMRLGAEPDYRAAVMRYTHFRAQTDWICMPGEDTPALDFLGRFESMSADLATVRARLGLVDGLVDGTSGTDPGDVHRRASRRGSDYRESYTDETREIVGNLYAHDIRVLDYQF